MRASFFASAFVVVVAAGCPVPQEGEGEAREGEGEGGEGEGEDLGCVVENDTGFAAPAVDVTARVGSAGTFDIGTWNLAHFGNTDESPVGEIGLAADVISSLDLDLIGVQEIESERAFQELVQRLPEHEGILQGPQSDEAGFDQRVGVVYRCTRLTARRSVEIFQGNFNFPRAPLQVDFTYHDDAEQFDFTAIVVHFKAFEDVESRVRRQEAFFLLQNYVDSLVNSASGNDNVVVLGDFNERLDEPNGAANWEPFLDTAKYTVHTEPLADRGDASFISNSNAILDHVVTTRAFDDEAGAATASIRRVDADIEDYRDLLSDHRPVTLIMRGF
jgi:endonuclease/exonuclease/phosphatase family metal-dependent hydrolase